MHGTDLAGLRRVYLELHLHSLHDHQRITLGHGVPGFHQAFPDVAGNLRADQFAEFRQVRHVRCGRFLGEFVQFRGFAVFPQGHLFSIGRLLQFAELGDGVGVGVQEGLVGFEVEGFFLDFHRQLAGAELVAHLVQFGFGHRVVAHLVEEPQQPGRAFGELGVLQVLVPDWQGPSHQLVTAGGVHAVDAHVYAANAHGALGRVGAGRVVLGGEHAVPWVQGHGAGGAQVDIAQAQHQVPCREQDVAYRLSAGQAVDALHEVDVVGQPRGCVAHGLAVFVHRFQGGAVFEGHGQMNHPAAHFQLIRGWQGCFQVQQVGHQCFLRENHRVVPQLQGAHAGGEFQQAVGLHVGNGFHQGVDAQAEAQVHYVGAVFQQEVLVAGLAVGDFRTAVGLLQVRQDGGGEAVHRFKVWLHQVDHRRRHQALDGQFLALGELHSGVVINGHEPDGIAGFHLAHLPQLRLGDGHRTHKAAEAGAVLGENHGHVAGEVDGADGVFAVVDVRGVQARFAAVGPGELGLGSVQADAQAVGVVVHLPVLLEELFDGLLGEEIRRAVGAIEHADFPVVRVIRNEVRVRRRGIMGRRRGGAGWQVNLADAEHVAGAQGPAAVAAELAEGEGGAATQVHRHIKAAAHGEIGSAALDGLAHRQNLAGFHGDGFPEFHRLVVQSGIRERAGEGNHRVLVELQAGADEGGFEAGGFGVVSDDAVGNAEGVVVHGATGWYADVPVTHAARIILHGGVGAGFDHFGHGGFELEALQGAGGDNAISKALLGDYLAQVIQVGGNAHQPGFRQGGFQFGQRVVPVFAVHNQLGNHRVVVGGDFAAVLHPGVHPHAVFRPVHVGQLTWGGLEILQRVFRVDAHFHGRTVQFRLEVGQVRAFAGGDFQHPFDQIQTGDRLGDRMLYL